MNRILTTLAALATCTAVSAQDNAIIHDAEYYVLKAQLGEQWTQDDAAVDAALAAFREGNGGKPPNIVSILIDDMGFGDMGIPELNAIRGYSTPNINEFSDEAMRLVRMYTEPSCTPTRVAQMTGRLPVRMGMGDCPSSDNLGQLSVFRFGGSGSSLIEFMRFQFGGASAA